MRFTRFDYELTFTKLTLDFFQSRPLNVHIILIFENLLVQRLDFLIRQRRYLLQ